MSNKSLFFYGLGSRLVTLTGALIAGTGFALGITYNFLFFILTAVGIAVYFYGASMRFDFKIRSGTIIHAGDGIAR